VPSKTKRRESPLREDAPQQRTADTLQELVSALALEFWGAEAQPLDVYTDPIRAEGYAVPPSACLQCRLVGMVFTLQAVQ